MISPLRQSHRRMFIALGVLLPLVFVVGIAGRKPVPVATHLPVELANSEREPVTRSELQMSEGISNKLYASEALRIAKPRAER